MWIIFLEMSILIFFEKKKKKKKNAICYSYDKHFRVKYSVVVREYPNSQTVSMHRLVWRFTIHTSSRTHAYIILTPLKPTFI